MQDAGLEVLTAAQIKKWWSTYHRKKRNLLATGLPQASDVPPSAPSATVPSSTASLASVPSSASSATVLSSSALPATVPTTLTGHLSQLPGAVIEWPFPEDFSQSTIEGENGSNACACEGLKQTTSLSAHYTSRGSWYPLPKRSLGLFHIPLMEQPPVGRGTHEEIAILREWAKAYDASV